MESADDDVSHDKGHFNNFNLVLGVLLTRRVCKKVWSTCVVNKILDC